MAKQMFLNPEKYKFANETLASRKTNGGEMGGESHGRIGAPFLSQKRSEGGRRKERETPDRIVARKNDWKVV